MWPRYRVKVALKLRDGGLIFRDAGPITPEYVAGFGIV